MFYELIEFPITSKKLSWEAKEVIRDFRKTPMMFQRITLTGTLFPERALKPFVRVGESVAYYTEIARDGLKVNAYFDHPLTEGHTIEFGYGDKVFLVFPGKLQKGRIRKLDLKLIPRETKNIERFK